MTVPHTHTHTRKRGPTQSYRCHQGYSELFAPCHCGCDEVPFQVPLPVSAGTGSAVQSVRLAGLLVFLPLTELHSMQKKTRWAHPTLLSCLAPPSHAPQMIRILGSCTTMCPLSMSSYNSVLTITSTFLGRRMRRRQQERGPCLPNSTQSLHCLRS